jgi:hypothetical protein
MMKKNNIVKSFTFVFLSILVVAMFYFAQLNRNYITTLLAMFSYATLLSLLVAFRQTKYVVLLLMIWGFVVWHLYYTILTPNWILANGDLILMSKVSEETVSRGFYPFNDETLLSIRSNYVLYPTSFTLQAILSITTSIDTQVLMYVPILMYAIYILVIILTILLMKETPSVLLPFVVLPLLSFVSPKPTYFVYSHVSRALLFLFLYTYVKVFFSQKSPRYVVFTLLLLAISSSLGHSQEPIMFSIFLALLMVLPLIHRIKRSLNILIPGFIFISLVMIYNIYIAILTFQGIALFSKRLLLALTPEASIEAVDQKVSIAQGILTREELALVALGFGVMMVYVAVILLRHLIHVLSTKNIYATTLDLAILLYGGIALLPLIIPGIGADLFWRPLWTLFIALALWPLAISHSSRGRVYYRQVSMRLILIIMIALFAFSNLILMRLHLVSSDVYTHEALIVDNIAKSSFVRYLQSTESVRIILLDSPYQPAYEIRRALTYLMPETRVEIVVQVLQPEVKWYVLSYLNGVTKLREYVTKYDNSEEDVHNSYIFVSSHDIPSIFTLLTSKNVMFNSRDIIVLS